MYEEYWGLSEKPFENTPDPRFLYSSPQHKEALARLLYAVEERKGAAMLSGVFGCGKTLLIQALMDELGEGKYHMSLISYPQLTDVELLMAITEELGGEDLPTRKTEVLVNVLLTQLKNILTDNMKDGRETVILIDEAHIIEDRKIFEELRLLLNFQERDRFLLTLILVGQPELADNIKRIKQLEQRIAIRCQLTSFSDEETTTYIGHRLAVAQRREPIFTPAAVKVIHEHSGVIPRRINNACDLGLLTGSGREVKEIDDKLMQEVVKDLGM